METYGRYQLLAKLATGGMAQVYLARQSGPEGFEKLVVLKRILPHLAENAEFVRMFLQEARLSAQLNHPHIAQIYDLGKVGDSYFIAMEYVHGEDVRRVVRQAGREGRTLPVPLACRIVIGACEGLEFAHQKADDQGRPLGIVHRDVSPQNLLVTFEGGVKLIDFGIAKAADSASHTKTGVLKGKYSYMSPEQAEGRRVDKRSDVFALGIVLYELVTQSRLFKRHSDLATIQAVMACRFKRPSQVNPAVDPDLEAIILKVLTKEREERMPSAGRLQLELEEYLLKRRLPGSSAHLKQLMREVYAERLQTEARLGRPWYEEELPPKATPSGESLEFDRPLSKPPPPVPPDDGADATRDSGAGRSTLTPVLPRPPESAPKADVVLAPMPRRTSMAAAFPPPLSPTVQAGDLSAVSRVVRRIRSRRVALSAFAVALLVLVSLAALLAVRRGARLPARTPAPPLSGPSPAKGPAVGAVRLTSRPPGASVALDGHALGRKTPALLADLDPSKEHEIALSLAGYEDDVVTVSVRAGHTTEVNEKLRPSRPELGHASASAPHERARPAVARQATLRVTTTPPVTVELDGQARGTSPLSLEVAPGRHGLRFLDPGRLLDQHQTVTLAAGQTQRLERTFVRREVRFNVTPWAAVYLGDHKFADSPGEARLYPGTYRVTYSCPDLRARATQTLVVPEGQGLFKVNLVLHQDEGG